MYLEVCRCNSTTAEFDAWAMSLQSDQSAPSTLLQGVGERAYLLPNGKGIQFRKSGVDFMLQVFGSPLPELRVLGPVDPRAGRPLPLPPAELTPKATTLYTGLALKILSRLP